jgi:hypothetical protein
MPASDGKMRTSDAAAPKNIIALDPIGTKPKSRADKKMACESR